MKKVTITGFSHAEVDAPEAMFGFVKIPEKHKLLRAEGEELSVSDGYHTFDELYDHRVTLFIALCKALMRSDKAVDVWRSRKHSDGSSYDGWYVLGIGKVSGKQITYHLPNTTWDETEFADTRIMAPEFDGHTPKDVLLRLMRL